MHLPGAKPRRFLGIAEVVPRESGAFFCPFLPPCIPLFLGMAEVINSNSSLAQIIHLQGKRGDDFTRTFRFWEDAAKTIPKPLAGKTFILRVKAEKNGRPVLTLSLGQGLTIQNTNELKLTITNDEMAIPAKVYVYDIEQTDENSMVFTPVEGDFKVDQDV